MMYGSLFSHSDRQLIGSIWKRFDFIQKSSGYAKRRLKSHHRPLLRLSGTRESFLTTDEPSALPESAAADLQFRNKRENSLVFLSGGGGANFGDGAISVGSASNSIARLHANVMSHHDE